MNDLFTMPALEALGVFAPAPFGGDRMQSVLAYLDAGSASLFVQLVLGGFAALAVTAKLYWRRLLTFLHLRKPEDYAVEAEEATPAGGETVPATTTERSERVVADTRSR